MSLVRLALGCFVCAGIVTSPVQAAPVLMSSWEFNGNWDSSNDPSFNLIPDGGAQLVPSPFGMAASFGGGYFSGPTNPALAHADSISQVTSASFNSGFSIVGTIRPSSASGSSSGNFLSHDTSFGDLTRVGFQFGVIYSDMSLTVQIRDIDDRRLLARTPAGSLVADDWQSVAVTWDGSQIGGIQIYIGNVPITTTITPIDSFGGLNGDFLPIRIGAGFAGSNGELRGFSGQIDCLALWNEALSGSQIAGGCATNALPEPSAIPVLVSGILGLSIVVPMRRRKILPHSILGA